MAFWTTNFTDPTLGGEGEPKRVFRFKVTMNGISDGTMGGNTSILWSIKDIKKPSFTIKDTSHKYLNHTFYYPGSVEWDPIDLTLVDPVRPDMTATIASIVEASGYKPPRTVNQLDTISKSKAASSLGAVIIEQFNSNGVILETWNLRNAFITKFNPGELKYDGEDLSTISLTLRYDWATCQTKNGSIANVQQGAKNFFNKKAKD